MIRVLHEKVGPGGTERRDYQSRENHEWQPDRKSVEAKHEISRHGNSTSEPWLGRLEEAERATVERGRRAALTGPKEPAGATREGAEHGRQQPVPSRWISSNPGENEAGLRES